MAQIGEKTTESGVLGADLVTGAATQVGETAQDVGDTFIHPVRTARKLERKGAPINKEIGRETTDLLEDSVEFAAGLMPERLLLAGLHAMKARARRKDALGTLSYRTLAVVNGGVSLLGGVLKRIERASEPPQTPRRTSAPARQLKRTARRATSTARRTLSRGARRARKGERRTA